MHEVKDGKITVSTGVTFEIKDAPIMVFDAISQKMRAKEPEVPVVYLEDKSRNEPNPNDPGYLKAMEEWTEEMTDRLTDASIVMSVKVDSVPENFPKLDDESWVKRLKIFDIEVSDDPDERFLAWVKYCAAPAAEDIYSLFIACARRIGVPEEDVADKSALFQGRKKRRID